MYKNLDIIIEEDQSGDINNVFNWLKIYVYCIKKFGVLDIIEEEWDIFWIYRFYVFLVVIYFFQRIKGIRF